MVAYSFELQARRWSANLEIVAAMIRRHGGGADVAAAAQGHSGAEWREDLAWASSERRRVGLSSGQFDKLKELLRERNREVWGTNSWTPD